MKSSSLFIVFVFAVTSFCSGQIKPSFFPEEIGSEYVGVKCYCKPGIQNKTKAKGVVLNYTLNSGGTLRNRDKQSVKNLSTLRNIQRVKFKIKYPIINTKRIKFLLGLSYEKENYVFEEITPDFFEFFQEIENLNLVNNSIDAIITQAFNEKYYGVFRLKYGLSGGTENSLNFRTADQIISFAGLLGKKINDDFEWGIGISVSNSFRRTNVLPFFLLNKNFNKKWGFESVLPANFFFRYNLRPTALIYFGAEYDSQSYQFDSTNNIPNRFSMNHSEAIASVNAEVQIYPWVWLFGKVGYQTNFSTDFNSKNAQFQTFQIEPKDGIMFRFGLFISPPKKYLNK